jgi:hypothetical protein
MGHFTCVKLGGCLLWVRDFNNSCKHILYWVSIFVCIFVCVRERERGGGGLQRVLKLLHFIFQRVIFKSVEVGGFWD